MNVFKNYSQWSISVALKAMYIKLQPEIFFKRFEYEKNMNASQCSKDVMCVQGCDLT